MKREEGRKRMRKGRKEEWREEGCVLAHSSKGTTQWQGLVAGLGATGCMVSGSRLWRILVCPAHRFLFALPDSGLGGHHAPFR